MFRSIRLLVAILAVQVLVLASSAVARTDVVVDAVGDVPVTAPAYLDIVEAKVTEQIGRNVLYFHMELAGPAPAAPSAFVGWNWAIDLPTAPGPDYSVVVRWCTQAMITNCGPGPAHWESALIGVGSVTVDAFPFAVDGATVKAYVDPALIGDPAAFSWWAIARLHPGPTGLPPTDLAPNSGGSSYIR